MLSYAAQLPDHSQAPSVVAQNVSRVYHHPAIPALQQNVGLLQLRSNHLVDLRHLADNSRLVDRSHLVDRRHLVDRSHHVDRRHHVDLRHLVERHHLVHRVQGHRHHVPQADEQLVGHPATHLVDDQVSHHLYILIVVIFSTILKGTEENQVTGK